MGADVLHKILQLPADKQQEVADLVNYLIKRYAVTTVPDDEALAAKRRSLLGRYKGCISMTADFNQTPDDFKDYI